MRLIKCYIENFGKLQDFSYNFQDGLNTIIEENGFGKTTFATFIKSMFYGLDTSKSEKSERKKFKPWQGGNFGGNIEFEINGKQYRIERFFGNKGSDDIFKLYDLTSNLECKDYDENIGEEIFKINKEGYERSTYIPQNNIQIDMEDSLNAKLGNVLESENDVNTSDEAIKILAEAMKRYIKIGNKGILNEKKKTLDELTRKYENARFDNEILENKAKNLNEINEKIKFLENERKEKQKLLSKKIEQGRKQAKLETYNNICSKLSGEEKRYNELNSFFNNEIPTYEKLQDLSKKIIEIEKIKAEIENCDLTVDEKSSYKSLQNKFENKNITEEIINNQILNCSKIKEKETKIQNEINEKEKLEKTFLDYEKSKQNQAKKDKLLLFGIIALVLIGILFINYKLYIGLIAILFGIVGAGIIFYNFKCFKKDLKDKITSLKTKLESVENNISFYRNEINDMQKEINDLVTIFDDEPVYEEKIMILTNIKTALNNYNTLESKKINIENILQSLIAKRNDLECEINSFLNKYFNNISTYQECVERLKINKEQLEIILEEMENTKKQKKKFEDENNVDELKTNIINDQNKENDISISINEININIDKLNDEKNQIKNQIEILENKIDENEYLETDINNLKEQIAEMEEKYNILVKTKDMLEMAKTKFSSNYLKGMILRI